MSHTGSAPPSARAWVRDMLPARAAFSMDKRGLAFVKILRMATLPGVCFKEPEAGTLVTAQKPEEL